MKYLKQLALILFFYLLGSALQHFCSLPIPGSILGMLLLWLALSLGLVPEKAIADTADFLLANLALFYIAPGLRLLKDYSLIQGQTFAVLALIFITTSLTLATSGFIAQFLFRKKEKN